jgi:hypothetical protein
VLLPRRRRSSCIADATDRPLTADTLGSVHPPSTPIDTSPEVYEMLIDRWRTMTTAARVELVEQLNADVERMAIAGILADDPSLSELQVRVELARRRYGDELADAAYQSLAD